MLRLAGLSAPRSAGKKAILALSSSSSPSVLGISQAPYVLRAFSTALGTTANATTVPTGGATAEPPPSSPSATAAHRPPALQEIPTLPIFGSMIELHSGIPPLDQNDMTNYFRRLYQTYGPFFSMGIPGFGTGLDGKLYIVRDLQEMMKVLKLEGSYPSGLVEREWPMIDWMNDKHYSSVGLLSRGEEWKRLRSFMQKDLLAPAAARDYLPGILMGAAKASRKAAEYANDGQLDRYFNNCALDMFTEVLFGGDGGGEGMSAEEYRIFCDSAVEGLSGMFDIIRDPMEHVYHKVGYKSKKVKRFNELFDTMDVIARRRLEKFLVHVQNGTLTKEEEHSYFNKLLQRQPESQVTPDELLQISTLMYVAAVDTTAAKTSWNLVQLSLHPEFQDQLYEQLARAVQKEGSLTPNVLDKSEVPLLQAMIRETHRCTPSVFADLSKQVSESITVYGHTLPAGSTIVFDSLTHQMDPNLVEDPLSFRPERWLKESVEARKGTAAAIVDHPFYSGPFSQGARRCPGSRVAYLEVQAMIAQLLLDWKIVGPTDVHWKDYPSKMMTLCVPIFSENVRFVPRTSEH